jgi:four helix bundle protein
MDDQAYAGWLHLIPGHDREDPIWRVEAYRLARYAAWRCGSVTEAIRRAPMGLRTADQLHRASWSIAANLAEGYGKSSVADRLRYYEIALGSARECVVWCSAARQVDDRISCDEIAELLSSIRRLLLTMICNERRRGGRRVDFGNGESR